MADQLCNGGSRKAGASKKKRPGRGPGVAQLEKILRHCDHKPEDTIFSHPFHLAPPPPMGVDFFRPPLPHGLSNQIWAPPPQSLTPMMNPSFWQIAQSSPSIITVEPPSNQRFYTQGQFVCNHHQHPNHTTSYSQLHEIVPRDMNMVKWRVSGSGSSSFQGSMNNDYEAAGEGSCTVPFYNFIQPREREYLKDEVEDGGMDLDLDLKL